MGLADARHEDRTANATFAFSLQERLFTRSFISAGCRRAVFLPQDRDTDADRRQKSKETDVTNWLHRPPRTDPIQKENKITFNDQTVPQDRQTETKKTQKKAVCYKR